MDVLRCSVEMEAVDSLYLVYQVLRQGVDFRAGGTVYRLDLVRAKNKFAFSNLTPSHFRGMLLNVKIAKKDQPSHIMFGEVQFKLKPVVNLLKKHESHRHYEYFRTLLQGNVDRVDGMLNKLFLFVDKVCVVPVLMSLLIACMDRGDSKRKRRTIERGRTAKSLWKWCFAVYRASIRKTPALVQWTSAAMELKQEKEAKKLLAASEGGDKGGNQKGKLPLDKTQLYRMAIQTVLRKWNPKRAEVAQTVFARIACYNVFERGNARLFDESHVQAALADDEERACWGALRRTAMVTEEGLPLIKVTEMTTDGFGKYQFKHLSFQEFMAAYETLNEGETEDGGQRTWAEAYQRAKMTKSVPFCESLVRCYLEDKQISVDPTQMRESSLKVVKNADESILLRAIASQGKFPTIGNVNLKDCSWITDEDLDSWCVEGSQAKSITIRGCPEITDKGVKHLANSCREITAIDLSGNTKITDVALEELGKHCNGLLKIDLFDCTSVTDAGLATLVWKCPRLYPSNIRFHKSLGACLDAVRAASLYPDLVNAQLTDCDGVTDGGLVHLAHLEPDSVVSSAKGDTYLAALAEKNKGVRSLDLSQCAEVTDTGLASVIEKCPDLDPNKITSNAKADAFLAAVSKYRQDIQEIDLTGCDGVTTVGLVALLTNCPGLHPDKIASTKKDDDFLAAVGDCRPKITEIDLTGCKDITDDGLAVLMSKCLNLKPDAVVSKAKGGDFLRAVADHHPDVTHVDCTGFEGVTDATLAALMQKCPQIHPDNVSFVSHWCLSETVILSKIVLFASARGKFY